MDRGKPAAARRERARADPGIRARRTSRRSPGRPAHDATYFPVLGTLVRYPGWLVWPFAALAADRRAGARRARRAPASLRPLRPDGRRVRARADPAAAVGDRGAAPVAAAGRDPARLREHDRPVAAGLVYRAGVVALVATVVLTWYGLLRRRFGGWRAGDRRPRLARRARCRARRRDARWVVPGRAAGAGRLDRRDGPRSPPRRAARHGFRQSCWRSAAAWRW